MAETQFIEPASGGDHVSFPVRGGLYGVGRLAAALNLLVQHGEIQGWHPGEWADWRHTSIDIGFESAADATLARARCLGAADEPDTETPDGMPPRSIMT